MLTETITRVNLGCGELPLDGWTNVDGYTTHGDIVGDFFDLEFSDLEEVCMYHALEHVSWRLVPELLVRIHSWLRPGGRFTVEVPNMDMIFRLPPADWQTYVYGCQAHEGEYHRSGFMPHELERALFAAGFDPVELEIFESTHPMRLGMPCILARGVA